MTYDGTDPNDDGIVEADVDNDSVNTDEAGIERVASGFAPATTTKSAVRYTSSESIGYVDNNESPGRAFNQAGTKYSDDMGESWSSLATSVPSGAEIAYIWNGYIFAVEDDPLVVHRADYSSVVSGGTTWSQVLSGQTDSGYLRNRSQYGTIQGNPDTGTLVCAEYSDAANTTGSNHNPKIHRSTDNGATWTGVFQETSDQHEHFHCVGHDPYDHGTFIAVAGDGNDHHMFKSTDDGKTWSQETWTLIEKDARSGQNPSKPTAVHFSPDYYLFDDDTSDVGREGSSPHGPWYVHKETGNAGMICSTNPARAYSDHMKKPLIAQGIYYDDESGYIYFGMIDAGKYTYNSILFYVRYIGDYPHVLDDGIWDTAPVWDESNGVVYSHYKRYFAFDGGDL